MTRLLALAFLILPPVLGACGSDNPPGGSGNPAADIGVGDACGTNQDCLKEGQECLTNFKGGYCGVRNCAGDIDCPTGSACVAHTDGTNYCFLLCIDKADCNVYRPVTDESNCSSNVDFVDGKRGDKACVPPS